MKVTRDTITNAQIKELQLAAVRGEWGYNYPEKKPTGRRNAMTRALAVDAGACLTHRDHCALDGVVTAYNRLLDYRKAERTIVLPQHVVDAIERYNTTEWNDGRDPSKFGALNAVAYIGEQVAALYADAKASR